MATFGCNDAISRSKNPVAAADATVSVFSLEGRQSSPHGVTAVFMTGRDGCHFFVLDGSRRGLLSLL